MTNKKSNTKKPIFSLAFLLILAFTIFFSLTSRIHQKKKAFLSGQIYISFADDASEEEADKLISSYGLEWESQFSRSFFTWIKVLEGEPADQAKIIEKSDLIDWAQHRGGPIDKPGKNYILVHTKDCVSTEAIQSLIKRYPNLEIESFSPGTKIGYIKVTPGEEEKWSRILRDETIVKEATPDVNISLYPPQGSIWQHERVGAELVSLPTVLFISLATTFILILLARSKKAALFPKTWQGITILLLALFSFGFIEYIQKALWTYCPCYWCAYNSQHQRIISKECFQNTLMNLVKFSAPVLLWGYNAFVLIPQVIAKLTKKSYRKALTYLSALYLIGGLSTLFWLVIHGNLNLFFDIYQLDQKPSAMANFFKIITSLVIILTWPAILAIRLWGGNL